jgi:hypothetical protein
MRYWCVDANVELVNSLAITNTDKEPARTRRNLHTKCFELGVSICMY